MTVRKFLYEWLGKHALAALLLAMFLASWMNIGLFKHTYPDELINGLFQNEHVFLQASLTFLFWTAAGYVIIQSIWSFLDLVPLFWPEPSDSHVPRDLFEWPDDSPLSLSSRIQEGWLRHGWSWNFLILLAGWMPTLIQSWPGKVMGDSPDQFRQFMEGTLALNSHHPVAHTLLLKLFTDIGTAIHQPAWGLYLMVLFQSCLLLGALALLLNTLLHLRLRGWAYGILLVYFLLTPVLSVYLGLLSKDVWYAGFLLLFLNGFFVLNIYRPWFLRNMSGSGLPHEYETCGYDSGGEQTASDFAGFNHNSHNGNGHYGLEQEDLTTVDRLDERRTGQTSREYNRKHKKADSEGFRFASHGVGFWILVYLCGIFGAILFRREGAIIILVTLLGALLIQKPVWKPLLVLTCTIVFCLGVNMVIEPSLGAVNTTSRREMLSIPMQITARYLKYHLDEVTDQEKAAIENVLDFDTIASRYKEDISDPVKNTWKRPDPDDPETYDQEVVNIRKWLEQVLLMMVREPETAFRAVLFQYDEYFVLNSSITNLYNSTSSARIYRALNTEYDLGVDIPESFRVWQRRYDQMRADLLQNGLLSWSNDPALWIWLALILLVHGLRCKIGSEKVLLMPLLFNLLVLLSGPVNGSYGRYEFPMMLYLPVLYCLCSWIHQNLIRSQKK